MAYVQARKDFEYLESVMFLDDAVEIDAQVFDLMRSPNHKTAERIYRSAIALWFGERRREGFHSKDKRLHSIAVRYNEKLYEVEITK